MVFGLLLSGVGFSAQKGAFGGCFSPLVSSPGQMFPSGAMGEAKVGGNFGSRASGTLVSHPNLQIWVTPKSPNSNTEFTFWIRGFGTEVQGGGVIRKVQPKFTTMPRSSLPSPSSKILLFG